MYNQIQAMMHDYHAFASHPIFTNVRSLMDAVHTGQVLISSSHPLIKSISSREITKVLNKQWRSMSNTSSQMLAFNVQPKTNEGLTLVNQTVQGIRPDSSILVKGTRTVMANYLAYYHTKKTKDIYFSLKKNLFVETKEPTQQDIPIATIYSKTKGLDLLKPQSNRSSLLQSQFKKALKKHLINEIRHKLSTFTFSVKICKGLTDFQEEGWYSALKEL